MGFLGKKLGQRCLKKERKKKKKGSNSFGPFFSFFVISGCTSPLDEPEGFLSELETNSDAKMFQQFSF